MPPRERSVGEAQPARVVAREGKSARPQRRRVPELVDHRTADQPPDRLDPTQPQPAQKHPQPPDRPTTFGNSRTSASGSVRFIATMPLRRPSCHSARSSSSGPASASIPPTPGPQTLPTLGLGLEESWTGRSSDLRALIAEPVQPPRVHQSVPATLRRGYRSSRTTARVVYVVFYGRSTPRTCRIRWLM